MIPHPRGLVRRLRRLPRPALVVALVAAQCVTAFGHPVVVRSGETIRRCGCKVRGPSERCCCGPRECCGGTAGKLVEKKPEPPRCPKCKIAKAEPSIAAPAAQSTVRWLPGMSAHTCHGDHSLGFAAEFPSIPPPAHAIRAPKPRPSTTIPTRDDLPTSRESIPPDPPPRHA